MRGPARVALVLLLAGVGGCANYEAVARSHARQLEYVQRLELSLTCGTPELQTRLWKEAQDHQLLPSEEERPAEAEAFWARLGRVAIPARFEGVLDRLLAESGAHWQREYADPTHLLEAARFAEDTTARRWESWLFERKRELTAEAGPNRPWLEPWLALDSAELVDTVDAELERQEAAGAQGRVALLERLADFCQVCLTQSDAARAAAHAEFVDAQRANQARAGDTVALLKQLVLALRALRHAGGPVQEYLQLSAWGRLWADGQGFDTEKLAEVGQELRELQQPLELVWQSLPLKQAF